MSTAAKLVLILGAIAVAVIVWFVLMEYFIRWYSGLEKDTGPNIDPPEISFLLRKELHDAGTIIMDCFGVSDFHRDYEDTWEWLEGHTADGLHVNVLRPHNWSAGQYDRPVIANVKWRSKSEESLKLEVYSVAQSLADRLGVEVSVGETFNAGNWRTYEFRAQATFFPRPTSSAT